MEEVPGKTCNVTNFTDLAAGTYNVWIRYCAPQCEYEIGDVTINNSVAPTVTNITSTHTTCGDDNGTITFTFPDEPSRTNIEFSTMGNGASANYETYTTLDNVGTYTITGLAAGTYDLWVRWGDNNCPVDLSDVTINNSTSPALGGANEVCQGLTATVTPTTGGTWSSSDNAIATVTNAGLVTGVSPGNVTLTFTRTSDGCVETKPFTVHITPSTAGPTETCVGSTESFMPNSGGTWNSSNPAVATITNAGVLTALSSGSTILTFTLTSTGCVSNPINFTVNDTPGVGGATGVCVSGTAGVTPSTGGTWSSNDPGVATVTNAGIVTGVSAGTVTLTFTETATGCSSDVSFTVNSLPATPTVNVDCSGGFGNAVLTVTNPTGPNFEYSLNSGTYQSSSTFSGVANGAHTVTVRNTTTNCVSTAATVNVNCGCAAEPAITLSATGGSTCGTTPITVSGNTFTNANQVTLSTNGGGSITPNATTSTPFNFTYTPVAGDAGNTVTVTIMTDDPDGAGPCTAATETYTLNVNSNPTLGGATEVCEGASANVTPSGGGTWSSSNTGVATVTNAGVVTGVSAGSVTLTYTNTTTGCSNTVIFMVNPIPLSTYLFSVNGPTTCGGSDGSFSFTSTDLLPNTTYQVTYSKDLGPTTTVNIMTNGSGDLVVGGLSEGDYSSITATSPQGCTFNAPAGAVLTDPTPPVAPTVTVDCSGGFGNAVLTVTNPTGANFEYSLNGGTYQSSTTFSGVANGSHSVTVRNTTTNCESTAATVNVNCDCANQPTVSLSTSGGSTCGTTAITVSGNTFGGSATEVTLTHDGGGTITAPTTKTSSPFSFEYTPVAGDAGNTVTITVTSDNPLGAPCVAAVSTYSLFVNSNPSTGGATEVCEGATANVTPSTGGTWSSSNTGIATVTNGGLVTGVSAGSVTLTFTETATGCSSDVSFTVNPAPDAGANQNVSCFSSDAATMAATGSGT